MEYVWISDFIGDVLKHRFDRLVMLRSSSGYAEVQAKLLVCEHDSIGIVDDKNAINCRLGLRSLGVHS